MAEMEHEEGGRAFHRRRQEHGRARHARRPRPLDLREEAVERDRRLRQDAAEEGGPAVPGGHAEEDRGGDGERHPAPALHLDDVGAEEGEVDRHERARQRARPRDRPVPAGPGDHVEERRRDRHRPRHRDPVRGGERARRAEADDQQETADHQGPVDRGDVDLAGRGPRGVDDRHAGAQPELHALLGQREGARDQGLRGDHRRHGGERDQRVEERAGRQLVEGVLDGSRLAEHEGPLAEVVEEERGQHAPKPDEPDRPSPEVSHVRVERLRAGHGEDHRAEHE